MVSLQKLVSDLKIDSDMKIVMFIIDGLGGLPNDEGLTELEAAETPNLDRLAKEGSCGLVRPIAHGITPGSGPAHLALFGYDPISNNIKRGVLAAFGMDFDMKEGDLAARGNFATLDSEGNVKDRRAGRISTEENERLCSLLKGIKIGDTACIVEPVKEHRVLVVFRGGDLDDNLRDTDPQTTGVPPLPVKALSHDAESTVVVIEKFLEEVSRRLSAEHVANGILLRGFSGYRVLPSMKDIYGLKSIGIASYPMYRGLARLVGMDLAEPYTNIEEAVLQFENYYEKYDFFFIHYKYADSRGEDGDFAAKVKAIEEADTLASSLLDLDNTVVVVTGDHSTPAKLASHSWHPVPLLINGPFVRRDSVRIFGEDNCLKGALGIFRSEEIMPLAMANAKRLEKFGA